MGAGCNSGSSFVNLSLSGGMIQGKQRAVYLNIKASVKVLNWSLAEMLYLCVYLVEGVQQSVKPQLMYFGSNVSWGMGQFISFIPIIV